MLNYSANGPSGYNLTNSLRFRASNSAYLSRTPASAGSRTTWTWSAWVKRGALGTPAKELFTASTSGEIFFGGGASADTLCVFDNSTTYLVTTQLFRDPSAWYHIVIAWDTTQATSSNRIKMYVNGTQITSFSTQAYPALNATSSFNNNTLHNIGEYFGGGSYYFDGYMTEVNFVDGQALTPSSFGNTNSVTGVWQPAKYTGTYGTNGFYLNFTDIAQTVSSNVGLGKDFSGNTNYWVTNNISTTAGTTYDAMSDVPTLTSATVANYAVINPLDFISANGTISSANLNWASSTNVCGNRATIGSNSGKWYWEAVGSSVTSGTIGGRFAFTGSDTIAVEQDKFGMYWHPTSGISRIVNGTDTNVTSAYTYTNGDVLALALDLDNNISYWYKNGVLQYTYDFSSFSTIGSRIFFPYVWNGSSGTPSWVYNFGQRPFAYTPRTNHVRLNTFNLPTSTIPQGNKVMDATLWTGNGSTQVIVNQSQFRPDFVWIKSRNNGYNNALYDSVRGTGKALFSNASEAEATVNDFTAFNSNGFTVDGSTRFETNKNGTTYVGWQWQAGQGSTSSNTSGSITSTVSVNTTAGFSVATYTGNGTSGATVGHGLGVAPKVILLKSRSVAANWTGYFAVLGNGFNLILNSTAASSGSSDWNSTSPTSTVFTLGSGSRNNQNTTTYVAYCWAEIAGFSKFGSYTGNGSADGPMIYTGFRPKYIMIKSSSIAGEWALYDVPRDLYNPMGLGGGRLRANTADAETGADSAQYIDFLSNGFKIRNASGFDNDSGATYIYMAFASNPFKNSNAF
jgi:hypothetical protein